MGARISRPVDSSSANNVIIKIPLARKPQPTSISRPTDSVPASGTQNIAKKLDEKDLTEDWSKRPEEDDRVRDNFRSLHFSVRSIDTTINRETTKALQTLRNRQKLLQQRHDGDDSSIVKAQPGKLLISQIHELLGYRRSAPDRWTSEALAERFKIDQEQVSHILKHFNIYETVGNSREGFYGTWAEPSILAKVRPMPSELKIKQVLDRIQYEQRLDSASIVSPALIPPNDGNKPI